MASGSSAVFESHEASPVPELDYVVIVA